ncbi:hypothetical protein M4I17_02195 [Enterococcus thailandicus]|uniref:hypothetical protein n=1 Tax=Enterococcus thailandicus TaxID=417368 RepID=UPI002542CA21|nr:hypothetical protein [Enterococcus thailandicus]MDK4351216.1 hypothetical protein [Enterococcus thailandicus]MDT2845504.1 hypothetical protein [Enterococcus thailandicus]
MKKILLLGISITTALFLASCSKSDSSKSNESSTYISSTSTTMSTSITDTNSGSETDNILKVASENANLLTDDNIYAIRGNYIIENQSTNENNMYTVEFKNSNEQQVFLNYSIKYATDSMDNPGLLILKEVDNTKWTDQEHAPDFMGRGIKFITDSNHKIETSGGLGSDDETNVSFKDSILQTGYVFVPFDQGDTESKTLKLTFEAPDLLSKDSEGEWSGNGIDYVGQETTAMMTLE